MTELTSTASKNEQRIIGGVMICKGKAVERLSATVDNSRYHAGIRSSTIQPSERDHGHICQTGKPGVRRCLAGFAWLLRNVAQRLLDPGGQRLGTILDGGIAPATPLGGVIQLDQLGNRGPCRVRS